jgi:hypothetical protein
MKSWKQYPVCKIPPFILSFFEELGFELLAKQVLYDLSHPLSPFVLQLFFRYCLVVLPRASLDHEPPIYILHGWDDSNVSFYLID